MPSRPRIQVTDEELMGYRRVPGYGRTRLPDLPGGQYTVATRGRSSRRYYNPGFAVTDPRREIGDATYYRLRREADDRTRQQIKQRALSFRQRQQYNRQTEQLISEQMNLPTQRVTDIREQIAILRYTSGGSIFLREDRQPGGFLATMLEELGLRPPNAPWMVGDSDKEITRGPGGGILPGVNPAQTMIEWQSQSSIRGRVA